MIQKATVTAGTLLSRSRVRSFLETGTELTIGKTTSFVDPARERESNFETTGWARSLQREAQPLFGWAVRPSDKADRRSAMRRAFGSPLTTWAGLQAQVVQLVEPLQERRWQENRQHGRPFDLKRESDRSLRDLTPTFREIVSEIRAFAWRPDMGFAGEDGSSGRI